MGLIGRISGSNPPVGANMNMRVPGLTPLGIWIEASSDRACKHAQAALTDMMLRYKFPFQPEFRYHPDDSGRLQMTCGQALYESLNDYFEALHLNPNEPISSHVACDDLNHEILLAMLCAPVALQFNSVEQLESHVRIRRNIVIAAAKTSLNFETHTAERPHDFWEATEDRGWVLRAGVQLEDAIIAATQPEVTGRAYGFSCYRATEYILLLGIAQEAKWVAPDYLEHIENQCRTEVLRSDPFHLEYAVEYGTMQRPVPPLFYIPGDRVWFKNPDPKSSDVTGYEGSWVFYLGHGKFSNFWHRDRPFDLVSKCLEIYHWRNGLEFYGEENQRINEELVATLQLQTRSNPIEMQKVLAKMMAYRDPGGVYANGGCIDSTREIPRPNLF